MKTRLVSFIIATALTVSFLGAMPVSAETVTDTENSIVGNLDLNETDENILTEDQTTGTKEEMEQSQTEDEDTTSVVGDMEVSTVATDETLSDDTNQDEEIRTFSIEEDDPLYARENGLITYESTDGGDIDLMGAPTGSEQRLGVDVSYYQKDIDWNAAKNAGVEFAIIRVGYRGSTSATLTEDEKFREYIEGAQAAGIEVGVYFFTQAINTTEAAEEAEYTLNLISGYDIDLPVAIDYEYSKVGGNRLEVANLSVAEATAVCDTFCDAVEAAGYNSMVYTSKYFLNNVVDGAALANEHRIWIASYTDKGNPGYDGDYDFWQFGKGLGSTYGASSTYIDLDYWFDDDSVSGNLGSGRTVAHYDLRTDGGKWDGTYYYREGEKMTDVFFCDGIYTYYLQADGTPMKARLTYHPDGRHVIYFDENGHEVFNNFAHITTSISGYAVDDYCYFGSLGYMYVNVITYDQTGTKLYYINPFGVMETKGWFQFARGVKWGDGSRTTSIAYGYGYANADGTLMTNQHTYDAEGKLCYMQGNGVKK